MTERCYNGSRHRIETGFAEGFGIETGSSERLVRPTNKGECDVSVIRILNWV